MNERKEFGDFQTPDVLAAKVTALVAELFGTPDRIVEPTAGLGAFLWASANQWGKNCSYEGYEINREYVDRASGFLQGLGVELFHRDFFLEDWTRNLNRNGSRRVLVIGNPPWATNSNLGLLGSRNLPKKTNFQRLRGFDARTGKSNFDIAEWMLIRLMEALPPEGAVAMLCKTVTARKVLRHFWKTGEGRQGSCLFRIDAKASFGVAVDACLFFCTGRPTNDGTATVYADLDLAAETTRFGFIHGDLVSDIAAYDKYRDLDGGSFAYTWRSGVKHDATKVMEFYREGHLFRNGLGESVELEDRFVYPLLKSSDLGNGRVEPRKYVLITQTRIGDDTSVISSLAPKTWSYLMNHAEALDKRRSSIYRKRPRFSIFGIGRYSFASWKIAISGLYKSFRFVVIPPHDDRPVMIDDTCYSIPCGTEAEAKLLHGLLSSRPALEFLGSLVFADSKRFITSDLLRRISLVAVARRLGRIEELRSFVHSEILDGGTERQMPLLMEP